MSFKLKFTQFFLVFISLSLVFTMWVSVATAMFSSQKKISQLIDSSKPSVQTASIK